MNRYILTGMMAALLSLAARSQLSIEAPGFGNASLQVLGFRGLVTDTLFSGQLDRSGKIIVPVSNEGFLLMNINRQQTYPMLFSKNERSLILMGDGLPDFSLEPENRRFYDLLVRRQTLKNKISVIEEALDKYSGDTVLANALRTKKAQLSDELDKMSRQCIDSTGNQGALLVAAMGVLEGSYDIRTKEQLYQAKSSIRNFIRDHYAMLSNTDMLQQFAGQYMMMNEYVIVGKQAIEDQVCQDIRDWIVLLKGYYRPEDVVHYFLSYFRNRLMITMSGAILTAFPEEAPCPAHQPVAGNADLPADPGKKLVILIDVDCPASVTGQVMITRFLQMEKIPLHTVTIFCGRKPDKDDYRVLPNAEDSFHMPDGVAKIGAASLKIAKYPAFVMVNEAGQVVSIDYTLEGIKRKVKSEK